MEQIFVAVVLITLLSGIVLGYYGFTFPNGVEALLMTLLLIIGIDIGMAEGRIERLKKAWKEAFVLSIGTISGSLLAGLVLGIVLDLPLLLSVSVAAGMGWYSLTGPFLAKTMGAFAGALGFSSNFMRELLTIIVYPKIGDKASGISIGGATTMDSTLPIISKFSPELSLTAFVHGFIVSIAVPFLLSVLSLL
ncbi:lysine exporter LysO family protein [Archaeoglobus veneficus]|uniref:Lysine exporter LysO family protein n=1 Tax=Archaeoglobus veneficus (strain DSM 11195 / SNP6) TaxID=693661 RepID=F2KR92_ARCVS|nr:lysine exporter LysO family protein [Archaeoglobus veneficus]AEA46729.1 protein of unknown function DUF340 membrane [Archaeoglobus veneficus SNP6]